MYPGMCPAGRRERSLQSRDANAVGPVGLEPTTYGLKVRFDAVQNACDASIRA